MIRLLAAVLVIATSSLSRAEEPARAVILLAPAVPRPVAEGVTRDAAERGLEVAAPVSQPEPASEALLTEIRPLYQAMKFGDAVKRLEMARESLIAGRLPSPGLAKALGEVELWLGACLFLARDKTAAVDHWALAQRLVPGARPDRIFPPEVQSAFAAPRPSSKPVPIAVKLAPVDARLWLDGRAAAPPVAAIPGLHWIVVERADLAPTAQIVRATRSAAEIAVSLRDPASPPDALRQASERLRTAMLGRDEGIGISNDLQRPLWVVSARADQLQASRFSSGDVARPIDEVVAPAAGILERMCRLERCLVPPATVVIAPPVAPVPPRKPVWKRGWFWGVIAAGVVVVAGAATGAAIGATAARDYDVRVR